MIGQELRASQPMAPGLFTPASSGRQGECRPFHRPLPARHTLRRQPWVPNAIRHPPSSTIHPIQAPTQPRLHVRLRQVRKRAPYPADEPPSATAADRCRHHHRCAGPFLARTCVIPASRATGLKGLFPPVAVREDIVLDFLPVIQ